MGGLVKNQEERFARDRRWEDRAKNEVVRLVATREARLSTGRQQRHQVGIFYFMRKTQGMEGSQDGRHPATGCHGQRAPSHDGRLTVRAD